MFLNLSRDLKILLIFSQKNARSVEVYSRLKVLENTKDPQEADLILCLGGDGLMLHTLHKYSQYNKPIYGVNCGTLGFLMNEYDTALDPKALLEQIKTQATEITSHPLVATFTSLSGEQESFLAFNEVSLLRSEGVAAHLQVLVDGVVKAKKIISDGILLATPLGSPAYNKACGGPVLPLDSDLLSLHIINGFISSFTGALLQNNVEVEIKVLDAETRRAHLFCDYFKFPAVTNVSIKRTSSTTTRLLFVKNNNLAKIYNAQFHH